MAIDFASPHGGDLHASTRDSSLANLFKALASVWHSSSLIMNCVGVLFAQGRSSTRFRELGASPLAILETPAVYIMVMVMRAMNHESLLLLGNVTLSVYGLTTADFLCWAFNNHNFSRVKYSARRTLFSSCRFRGENQREELNPAQKYRYTNARWKFFPQETNSRWRSEWLLVRSSPSIPWGNEIPW